MKRTVMQSRPEYEVKMFSGDSKLLTVKSFLNADMFVIIEQIILNRNNASLS